MYKISEEQKNILINYFVKGTASGLPFNEVSQIIRILNSLEEIEEGKTLKNK